MERWSYQQITDPQFKWDQAKLIEQCQGKVLLELHDGELIVGKRMAMFNLFFMQVLQTFNIPVCKRHWIKRRAFNDSETAEAWNQYYDEIVAPNPRNAKTFKMAVWRAMQDLYTFTSIDLLPWTCSIDGQDISEVITDPQIEEIIQVKETFRPEMGTDVIEKILDIGSKKMMNLLGTPGALQNEALLPFQRVRQLNKFQVPQTLFAYGVRTDVNDNIISLPVKGSGVEGLRDISEFGCESLSAKKSQFYSQVAVPGSQYFGRKQHLIASTIEHIYDRDCGSTALVDFNVTEKNYSNLVGKIISIDGQYVVITKKNVKEFINTTIHMRSPMTCKYRNGVCTTCGGKIFDNINRKMNLGILGAIQVIEPTTQKILSAKHLIKTNTIVYTLPAVTNQVLHAANATDLYWAPQYREKLDHMEMGIPLKCFPSIHDITMIRRDKTIHEERYSQVTGFILRPTDPESTKVPLKFQLENNGQIPFLSADMLLFIRDMYGNLKMDKQYVWIPLRGTQKLPIFKNIVINDNMFLFVKTVDRFLSRDIKEYTRCSDALNDFSRIVHDKVSANIVHLEILLKAYMISSQSDYRIPRVSDPNDVQFQTTASILNNRHVGTKLAYQGLNQYISHPSTYLVYHQASPFDWMTVI